MQFVHSFTSGVAGLRNFTFAVQDHVPHHQEILPIAIDGMIRCTTNKQTDRPLVYNVPALKVLINPLPVNCLSTAF